MTPADAPALHALINDVVDEKQFLRATDPYPLATIEAFLKRCHDPGNVMLTASYGQQLVAWLDIIARRDGRCGVLGMGVAKPYRSLQIGRQLLQQGLTSCLGRLQSVHLEVYQSNLAAIKLYKSFGFVENECQSGILSMSKLLPESYFLQ